MQINYKKLKSYLENNIFTTNIKSFIPITRGGSSLNFFCETESGKFIVKSIPKEKKERVIRLCEILNALEDVPAIYTAYLKKFNNKEFFEYEDMLLIIISYIDGKRIASYELNTSVIDKIFSSYQHIQHINIKGAPEKNLQNMYLENKSLLNELLKSNKGYIRKKILNSMYQLNEELNIEISLNQKVKLIHGDASLNNCLIDKDGKMALLDFELVRYGYEIEDWTEFLISSLSQHCILFLPEKRFETLINHTNKLFNFTKTEWLYGVVLYFLNLLNKRLKARKLFKSTRKSLLFILNKQKYRTIKNIIEKIY